MFASHPLTSRSHLRSQGYGGNEDPRSYHPKLRPPVDPRELEIDPRTGMKNYIGNESGNWDTSVALIRRTIEKCIHYGRQNRATGNNAVRLLVNPLGSLF